MRNQLLPVDIVFNSRHFSFNYSHGVWDEKTPKLGSMNELRAKKQELEAAVTDQSSRIVEDTAVQNAYKEKRLMIEEEVRKLQKLHADLDVVVACLDQLVKTHFELNRLQKVAGDLEVANPALLTGAYGKP